jgi:HAE1 family hydrophobic/amphiphilic exporter-1
VTISCAILVSGFVSLTLTPMLCARLLKPIDTHHAEQGWFWRMIDGALAALTSGYRWSLDIALNHRLIMVLITFATFALSVHMFSTIPKGFFPVEDTGFISGSTEAASDIAFPAMAERQKEIARMIMADPAVDYITSSVGHGGTNQGSIFIALKPKEERGDIVKVINRLRGLATSVPGINAVFQPVQNLNLNGGRSSRAPYQYTMQSSDLPTLYSTATRMVQQLRSLPQLKDVTSDLKITNPELHINIDRAKAAAFGLNSDQIRTALYNAYGSAQISTIFTQANDYQVILETAHRYQDDPSAIGRVYIRASNGSGGGASGSGSSTSGSSSGTTGSVSGAPIVPLDQVATITRSVGPLWVNRQSQQPSVTVSFNTAPGASIGEAVEAIRQSETAMKMSPAITTSFTGSAALFQDAQKGQIPLILAAVLTIYIVLGVLYESFIHPITILSGLPSAGIGALLWLQLFGMDLSVIAIIGILLLVGLVKKNAIMMIDFAIERRREGTPALPAIREAALIRFRPITMTTLSALLGSLPIALGAGAGAELRQPLGIVIVGGLCVSQLLTLYITPVIYYYLDKVDSFLSGRSKAEAGVNDLISAPALGEAAE